MAASSGPSTTDAHFFFFFPFCQCVQDAPMKFLYCVRAATKENVALPNVDNLMRPSAEYLNAKNAYLNSLRIRDTDHEQSSDADSDMRSESGVSSSAVAPAAPVVADVATTRAVNGNANSGNKHETEISTTITTTTTATNRTNNSPTTARTKNTVAATTTTNTKTPLPTAPPPTSTATSNGKETNCSVSQAQTNPKPSLKRTEDNAERTPTDRPAATSSEAVQRLSATPSQTNSPRNASEQPTKTNGNGNGSLSPFIFIWPNRFGSLFNFQINRRIHWAPVHRHRRGRVQILVWKWQKKK